MKKRKTAAIAAVLMTAVVLTGCGGNQAAEGDDMKLSVAVLDKGEIAASEGSYEDNRWTQWIKEQSGIDVTFVPIARSQSFAKLNAMLAAGNAPDIFGEYSVDYVGQLAQQGAILPLDDLINNECTAYKEYIEQNDQLKKYVTFGGQTYAFTSQRAGSNIINHSIWIRQDWLDKLGLSMPTTDQELLEVMRAFKTQDPNGNGEADEIPMAMIWSQVVEAMYGAMDQWYLNDEGVLEFNQLTENNVEALRFMKTCYDEGLMFQEFATDKDGTLQKQAWATGKTGVYMDSWYTENNRELMQNNPNANPVILPPVETKFGVGGYYKEGDAFMLNMVNANTENTSAIAKYIDWMLTTGWEELLYGEENVHYTMENGVRKIIDQDKFDKEVGYAETYAILTQETTDPNQFELEAAPDALSQTLAKQSKEAYIATSENNHFRRDIPRNPDVEEFTNLYSEWQTKRNEIRIRVITGGAEYTPEWGVEQLQAEWDRLGGQEVNRLVNEWYQANKADF